MEADASITNSRTMATATINWTGVADMHSGDSLEVRSSTGEPTACRPSVPHQFLAYYDSSDDVA